MKHQKQVVVAAGGLQVCVHMVIHISSSSEPVIADLSGFA